jgi:hypothetical protein
LPFFFERTPLPLLLLIRCPHTSKVNDMSCSTSISTEHVF